MADPMNTEIRKFVASGIFVVLLILMLLYLTFITVPADNKDLITTILGVLVGGAAAAMPNLFGSEDAEKEKLTDRIRSLERSYEVLKAEHVTLKNEYDRLTAMLINRHLVPENGEEK